MNGERRQARRYHWLSEGLTSFVDEPHAAIEGPCQGEIVNLTDRRAGAVTARPARASRIPARTRSCDELSQLEPGTQRHVRSRSNPCCRIWSCRRITTCATSDVITRRLRGNLAAAADRGPDGLCRPPAHARGGRSHCARPGHGRRSRPRRALSLQRSGAVLIRARRQGPPSLPGAAQGLRRNHPRPEIRGTQSQARAR